MRKYEWCNEAFAVEWKVSLKVNFFTCNVVFDIATSVCSFVKKSIVEVLSLSNLTERILVESLCGDHNKCQKAQRYQSKRLETLQFVDDIR
ncbi:putative cytoplasmic protein [Trichinella spiralis]|uniref:putative cytoplasmic protein n=1 Tax=Trichinella spiralis TaxID=6334 RepID=UPI0001EFC747|nr:putative cytoplasmic protein [Trichinella spiralis]